MPWVSTSEFKLNLEVFGVSLKYFKQEGSYTNLSAFIAAATALDERRLHLNLPSCFSRLLLTLPSDLTEVSKQSQPRLLGLLPVCVHIP